MFMVESTISIISIVIASLSALFTFHIWKTTKIEVQYLKKQVSYNSINEIKKSLDDCNNKIAEWDIDLPLLESGVVIGDGNERKKAIITLHWVNLLYYCILQEDVLDNEFPRFFSETMSSIISNAFKHDETVRKIINGILEGKPKNDAERKFQDLLKNLRADSTGESETKSST